MTTIGLSGCVFWLNGIEGGPIACDGRLDDGGEASMLGGAAEVARRDLGARGEVMSRAGPMVDM